MTGGSAKANSNFGPGLNEVGERCVCSRHCRLVQMERCRVTEGLRPEWRLSATMQVTSSTRAVLTVPSLRQEGRSFLASSVLGGKVYQIGGCLSEKFSTSEVKQYISNFTVP